METARTIITKIFTIVVRCLLLAVLVSAVFYFIGNVVEKPPVETNWKKTKRVAAEATHSTLDFVMFWQDEEGNQNETPITLEENK